MLASRLVAPLTGERTEEAVRYLAEHYPSLWVTTVGKSVMGRPIWMLRVGQGEPRLLYVATHHSLEWICGSALFLFCEEYLKEEARNRAPRGTIYLVPCLNPDGVELVAKGIQAGGVLSHLVRRATGGTGDTSRWQANARGVDLNHNYEAGFAAYKPVERALGITGPAPTRYSGESPLSEPETRALAGAVDTLSPHAVLSLHTQGREIYASRAARTAGALLARRIGYTLGTPEGAAAYGGLTDWLDVRGMPALTVECGLGVNPLPPETLPQVYREVLPLLLHAPRLLGKM